MIIFALLGILCGQGARIDSSLLRALQHQLPLWAEITGNKVEDLGAPEPIWVERTKDSSFSVYLPTRRIEAIALRIEGKTWITDALWCGGSLWDGFCDEWWNYPAVTWDTLGRGRKRNGFDRSTQKIPFSRMDWKEAAPPLKLDSGWGAEKEVCSDGFCVFTAKGKPYLGWAAIRLDGSVAWWNAEYIRETPKERMLVHGYEFVKSKGHSIPWGKPKTYSGQTIATWYNPSSAPNAVTDGSKPELAAPMPSRFILDSSSDLQTRAEKLPRKGKARRLDGKKLEVVRNGFAARKFVSRRMGDSLECTGVQRYLARYADGTEALLTPLDPYGSNHKLVPDVLVLRGLSIELLGLRPGDSMPAVKTVLGNPVGASPELLFYRSTQPYAEQEGYYTSLWEAVLIFRDGKLESILLERFFDDC